MTITSVIHAEMPDNPMATAYGESKPPLQLRSFYLGRLVGASPHTRQRAEAVGERVGRPAKLVPKGRAGSATLTMKSPRVGLLRDPNLAAAIILPVV